MKISNSRIALASCLLFMSHPVESFIGNIPVGTPLISTRSPKPVTLQRMSSIDYDSIQSAATLHSMATEIILPEFGSERKECSVIEGLFKKCIADPSVESEVLSDMGHFYLDIFTLMARASSIHSRLAVVIGRMLFIASDYIPDHAMRTDELVFQLGMLGLSIGLLVQSAFPLAQASLSPTSFRDKRAYCLLFLPVGLPWTKFKVAFQKAFEWVDIEPNSAITTATESCKEEDKTLFWLYNGNVDVEFDGSVVKQYNRKLGSPLDKENLYNEIDFFGQNENLEGVNKNYRNPSNKSAIKKNGDKVTSLATLRAGKSGATLLKVNVKKLLKLMNQDEILNDSVRNLLFKLMQQKAGAFL